jgi:hypothetical protein
MTQKLIVDQYLCNSMKSSYHHLINRSPKVPLVLVILVVSISLLSAISADAPVHHEGTQKYFTAMDVDLQSIALRPASFSKEVKEGSLQQMVIAPLVMAVQSLATSGFTASISFTLSPPHHNSLSVFLRVIRI